MEGELRRGEGRVRKGSGKEKMGGKGKERIG